MNPADIEEQEGTRKVELAKDQPQYGNLPALIHPDGVVQSRWSLSLDERRAILDGANVDLYVWTFGYPHPPISLTVQGVTYDEAHR